MREQLRHPFRKRSREHQDRQVDARIADRQGVAQAPGRERVDVAASQAASDRANAMPVRVGLQSRDDVRPGSEMRSQNLGVVRQRPEIDLHPARPYGLVGLHHAALWHTALTQDGQLCVRFA